MSKKSNTNTIQFKTTKYKGRNLNPLTIALLVFLILYTLSLFFPLAWGLMSSIKSPLEFAKINDAFPENSYGLPRLSMWWDNPTKTPKTYNIFQNYVTVFNNLEVEQDGKLYYLFSGSEKWVYGFSITRFSPVSTRLNGLKFNIIDMVFNTLLYSGGYSLAIGFASLPIAYLCARFNYKMSGIIYAIVIFVMSTPIVSSSAPLMTFLMGTGLYSEVWGEWLRHCTWTNMWFLIYYAFYKGLSGTYFEAAEIDGASQFRILTTIAIPLAKTILTTVILLAFVGSWQDYGTPLQYLPTMPTFAYGIHKFTQTNGAIDGVDKTKICFQVPAVMMLVIPVLIMFVLFKDQLMGNLTLGGIKE